jgi:hypothetical protein
MNLKTLIVMFVITMSFSLCASAQPMYVRPIIFDADEMTRQADSLKSLFVQQGFVMVREATIEMKSQYEKPIILPLTEGTWYRVIFIGDKSSKLYEVRMYDWNEKRVVYQKQKAKDVDGNIINYDYIPRFSEYHMIKPVQVNKTKADVNGCMLLFKKLIKP